MLRLINVQFTRDYRANEVAYGDVIDTDKQEKISRIVITNDKWIEEFKNADSDKQKEMTTLKNAVVVHCMIFSKGGILPNCISHL